MMFLVILVFLKNWCSTKVKSSSYVVKLTYEICKHENFNRTNFKFTGKISQSIYTFTIFLWVFLFLRKLQGGGFHSKRLSQNFKMRGSLEIRWFFCMTIFSETWLKICGFTCSRGMTTWKPIAVFIETGGLYRVKGPRTLTSRKIP